MSDCRFGVSPVNYPGPDPDRVLKYNQICSNDDTGLTLTIFMTWSYLFPNASA